MGSRRRRGQARFAAGVGDGRANPATGGGRAGAGLAVCLLAFVAGCPGKTDWPAIEPSGPREPPAGLPQVLGRINDNAARMDFTLEAQGDAAARHQRPDGKPELFDGRVKLLFRKPRDLYLELNHTLGGEVMQIGSNRDEFWVWKRLNQDRYWWGRHDRMDAQAAAALPIRPEEVVEVFGLGALPAAGDAQSGPLFEVASDRYVLCFLDRGPDGRTYVARRLRVDRRAPHLIREIEYLTPAGRVRAQARAHSFRQVAGSAVWVPGQLRLDWPGRDEFLQMKFDLLQRYDRDPSRAFQSPLQRGRSVGEQIRVDRDGGSGAALK
ncbi:MAG: hypothetical protein HRF43_19920 [Phycisphaerae bacterium]